MPTAANVNITTKVVGAYPSLPIAGIHFVNVVTERGPFNTPDRIITSWAEFVRFYGGLINSSNDPLMCKMILEAGGYLRVNRIGHYTDPSDADTLDPTPATKSLTSYVVFDADMVTSNSIDLDIDSTSITTVAFDTDNDTTMEALATEMAGHAKVLSASAVGKTGSLRVIKLVTTEVLTVDNIAVTNGASQANGVYINDLAVLNEMGEVLFKLQPIGGGDAYNGFTISLSKKSPQQYELVISDPTNTVTEERHPIGIGYTGGNTNDYNFYGTLNALNNNSSLFEAYAIKSGAPYLKDDLSQGNSTAIIVDSWEVAGGTAGGDIVAADYTGDSAAQTGVHAFDSYDDGWTISAFSQNNATVQNKLASYASSRGDLAAVVHIDNSNTTKTAIIAARDLVTDADKYTLFWGGGLKVLDPRDSTKINIPETPAVLSAISNTHQQGYHLSFAGPNRGVIKGAISPVNNFGSSAQYDNLNLLANSQINMAINRDGRNMLWGNFTGNLTPNQESYTNVLFLLLYIKKTLRPTLEQFIEEPDDILTFRRIYATVKPFFTGLANAGAFYGGEGIGWSWQGDQDAKDINSLQVNSPSDLAQGKYKVNFFIKPVNSMQQIDVNIILTDAGISFEEANTLI